MNLPDYRLHLSNNLTYRSSFGITLAVPKRKKTLTLVLKAGKSFCAFVYAPTFVIGLPGEERVGNHRHIGRVTYSTFLRQS